MEREAFDHVVVGAGLTGLGAALRRRREHPRETLLVLDAAARPGGGVATQRSNGFVCELGPFAFQHAELAPVLALLDRPPTPVAALATGRTGAQFDGEHLAPVAVDPAPLSFASGNEELVQACRRELGSTLRLGRSVTALRSLAHGFELDLGGESVGQVRASGVTLAVPPVVAAALLAPFDRALASLTDPGDERAFVFLGGHAADAPQLRGYGILPAPSLATPCAEAIFCTEVFDRRALPGRCLSRVEVLGDAVRGDDAAVATVAAAELRRWSGTRASLPFAKVHRFRGPGDPAAAVERHTRLAAVAACFAGLTLV